MIVIVTHRHADFDALGAVVAAHLLTPDAVPVIDTGNPPVETYLALHREALGIRTAASIDWATVDRVFMVDTQDPDRIDVLPADHRARVQWRVIDHHPVLHLLTGDLQIEPVGAAVTLVTEHLREQGLIPSTLQATTMALGIYVDTGGLLFPKTSPRDAAAYAWLLDQGANLAVVRQYAHAQLPDSLQALLEQLLADGYPITVAGHPGQAAAIVCAEDVSDAAGAVMCWTEIVGKPFTVAALQMGHAVHLIGRAALPGLDLATAWQPLGARGHAEACYAKVKGRTPTEVMQQALALLENSLPPAPNAREAMTAPVLSVPTKTTVRTALEHLINWGHGTLPITDASDTPVGLGSRIQLDKAIRHGLAHSLVTGIMRTPPLIPADTPQSDLPRLLAPPTPPRLLIAHGGRLVGIIAGSDLVRQLYGSTSGVETDRPSPQALAARLAAWAGDDVIRLLKDAGGFAAKLGMPLYWAGGSVRDLLLDRQASPDIDLVVDGDGIVFAKAWAAALGVQATLHEQFGTAKLTTPSGPVDVASSRRETYAHPGAQPDVRFSPISLDLARRDFTVNALAIRLDGPHFGQLLDFFGGWQDLQAKRLAVLHPLSYLEDPSRLWRAVRFERKLGFRMAPADEARARESMAQPTLDGYVNHRIAQEMRLLWTRESQSWHTLTRLAELGALRGLGIAMDDTLIARFRHFEAGQAEIPVADAETWLGFLALLLADTPLDRRARLLTAMKLSAGDQSRLIPAWDLMARPVPPGDVALHAWGEGQSRLAIGCALAVADDGSAEQIRRYWQTIRGTKLAITGTDLAAMGFRPGPMFGKVLSAVLRAKLAGEVASPDDERRLAAHLAARQAAIEVPDADRPE
ncbi:MAG: DHH family phosphoesterase [Candidatus Sericytochromatia bacterium]|nr:DHH family phosphoesterase [Candidatus Sericytochromatia bacterium]